MIYRTGVDTYTYSARNVDNPEMVMTFTLTDHSMVVSLTEAPEKISKIAQAEEKGDVARNQLSSQVQPLVMKLIEGVSGPISISDVNANLEGDSLKIMGWNRVAGLRLAPFVLNMGNIDNPKAAQAFVDELEKRKGDAPTSNRFFGPLDYWIGWIGMITLIFILLRRPGRRSKDNPIDNQ